MAEKNNMIFLLLGFIVLVAVVMYCCNNKNESYSIKTLKKEKPHPEKKSIEGFTALAAGANNNTGILLDDSYDLIPGADDGIPAHHFADMVNQGDLLDEFIQQPKNLGENMRPQERLGKIQGSALMPRTSTYVTPYNVDVANPSSAKYMVNTPRVTTALKSKYKDYSQSTMIRGDIPITYHANIALIAKTIQGRDDLNLSGLFSPHFKALYQKYTGSAYKNLVQKVAGAGQAAGYGGASGEIIGDNY